MKKVTLFLLILLATACTKQLPSATDPRYVIFKSHYYEATLVKTQLRGIDAPYLDTITVKYNPLEVLLPDTVKLSQIRNLGRKQ
jgi:hypothetical protein